jgi:peptide/nickel transport system permease protein
MWLVILLVRIELLLGIYKMIFCWGILFFNDSETALKQISFDVFDNILSGLLLIIIPVIIFSFRQKLIFLDSRISSVTVFFILLIVCFLFAPVVSNKNPEFYKNIGMTKLLPPLSTVNILHFKENAAARRDSPLEEFIFAKNNVLRKTFDETIQYIDSLSIGKKIIYFQDGSSKEIDKEELTLEGDNPIVTTQIFLLGSDQFGRDIFTRLVYGARISLLVGLGSVVISLFVGLTFGFLAGYSGGIFDIIFSRITDMFLSFPMIFLIVLVLALFGNSLLSVIIVLGFSGWMSLFKIVRTEVLSVKDKNYFVSARLLGLSKSRLLIKEILPVIIVPVVVSVIFQFGNVIIAESALSYLGLGLGNNYSSWGSMIQSGQEYLSSAWWMIFFPGITLIFTLLSANSFGMLLNRTMNPRLQND